MAAAMGGESGAMVGLAVVAFAIPFLVLLYFILQEGLWQGQTLGKKAAGLRVIMADGTPITFPAATYRNILRFGDFFPACYLIGFVLMFTNERAQRLGDLAAGTIVIHDPQVKPNFNPAPHRVGVHPFEATVGELRKMTLEEYFAIKRLCDRFPELPPETQTRSIGEIWQPFAEKHGIEPVAGVHPVYLMEAVIMSYGRQHKLV